MATLCASTSIALAETPNDICSDTTFDLQVEMMLNEASTNEIKAAPETITIDKAIFNIDVNEMPDTEIIPDIELLCF